MAFNGMISKLSLALLLTGFLTGPNAVWAQEINTSGIPNAGAFSGENIKVLTRTKPALSLIKDAQSGYTLKSGKQYINLVNRIDTDGTPTFVISGEDAMGNTVPIAEGDVWLENSEGSILPIRLESMEQAKTPILVTVLMDMSGSMSGQENKVTQITNDLFNSLPNHVNCQAVSFGGSREVFGSTDTNCVNVNIPNLTAGGKTPAFEAIETTLFQTRALPDVQRIILVITDGDPTDHPSNNLSTLRKTAHIIFFWVGSSDGARARSQFEFIADRFVEQDGDPFTALREHVSDLDFQIRNQVVIRTATKNPGIKNGPT